MNVKQFAGDVSHEEMYTKVVNAIGLEYCFSMVPATAEEVTEALKTDEHLNNIPLEKWDRQYPSIRSALARIGITTTSLSTGVCTLKQCARMYVQR